MNREAGKPDRAINARNCFRRAAIIGAQLFANSARCYRQHMPESGRTVRDNAGRHRFEIDLGDGSFAFAEYTLPEGKIMFTHTEVPQAHEGEGLGTALIRAGLASADERGLKVIPICPFFAAYMQKHADVQHLLDPAWRRKFGLD